MTVSFRVPIDQGPLDTNFKHHPPSPVHQEHHERLRELYKALAEQVLELVPSSRERSVALTELETSLMWANAGVARNHAAFFDAPPEATGGRR